jgi:acetyl esterase/lipase
MAEKRNLNYISEINPHYNNTKHLLDIFYPDDVQNKSPILIFIHGGTWMNGSKDIYSNFGKNLATKGIVSAIINYRLGDTVNFRKMALDCASAVKWVYNNADKYGGNKKRIFVCGHSAGGHLSALISLDHDYFDQLNMDNPIKGCILNDAFGLNLGNFIKDHGASYLHYIEKVFTRDPDFWKQASPIHYVSNRIIPFMIMIGKYTYPILKVDNEIFIKEISKYNPEVTFEEVEGKSHVEMITQFNDRDNSLYNKILSFMNI